MTSNGEGLLIAHPGFRQGWEHTAAGALHCYGVYEWGGRPAHVFIHPNSEAAGVILDVRDPGLEPLLHAEEITQSEAYRLIKHERRLNMATKKTTTTATKKAKGRSKDSGGQRPGRSTYSVTLESGSFSAVSVIRWLGTKGYDKAGAMALFEAAKKKGHVGAVPSPTTFGIQLRAGATGQADPAPLKPADRKLLQSLGAKPATKKRVTKKKGATRKTGRRGAPPRKLTELASQVESATA